MKLCVRRPSRVEDVRLALVRNVRAKHAENCGGAQADSPRSDRGPSGRSHWFLNGMYIQEVHKSLQ